MKLDYDFIKQILLTMENYHEHEINNYELMKLLNITADIEDKFIGHILLMGDNGLIDYCHTKYAFGFAKIPGCKGYKIIDDDYRITANGYEFLDILKNDTILKKIKNFAIQNAWEIGKQLIIESAKINML